MPPGGEKGRIFGGTAGRAAQGQNLANHRRTLPFGEAQPNRIAVLVEANSLEKGMIALALDALLRIALPDTHHSIQALALLILTYISVRTRVRRIGLVPLFLHYALSTIN